MTKTKTATSLESIASQYSHDIGAIESIYELYSELEVPTLDNWLKDIRFQYSSDATVKQFLAYVQRSQANRSDVYTFDPQDIGFGAFEAMLVKCWQTGGTLAYVTFMSAVEALEDVFILSVLEQSFQEIKAVMLANGYRSPGFTRSPIQYA